MARARLRGRGLDRRSLGVDAPDPLVGDFAWATCGDLDRDGFRDLLYGASSSTGAPPVHGYVEARSSRDGAVLFRITRADLDGSAPR